MNLIRINGFPFRLSTLNGSRLSQMMCTGRDRAIKGCKQSKQDIIIEMQKSRHCASRLSRPLVISFGLIAAYFVAMTYYIRQHLPQDLYQLFTPSSETESNTPSSKPRAILHIGPHKTSSTYIQSKIFETQDQLKQEGFVIPVAKTCPEGQQVQWNIKHFAGVAGNLKGDMEMTRRYGCSSNPLADLQDSLRSIYSANDSTGIIFSSEEFDNLDDDKVAELAKILANYQTTVVIYFRRKVEHIVSYYGELSKAGNPLASPSSFSNFFWKSVASLDPAAEPNDPIHVLNGLCYKRLFETYSRHFGAQNLAVINLSGLKDIGKDPWEVLVQEVIMLSLRKGTGENNKAASKDEKEPWKTNISPSSISFSVANQFYQWRWGNPTTATAMDSYCTPISPSIRTNSSARNTNTARSLLLPKLNCVLPFLKPLERVLPKKYHDLRNICKLWELQEQKALNRLADERSQLLYFDKGQDRGGKEVIVIKDSISTGPYQVDMEKLLQEHGKCAIATIPTIFQDVFNNVAAKIDKTCPYDQVLTDPTGSVWPV